MKEIIFEYIKSASFVQMKTGIILTYDKKTNDICYDFNGNLIRSFFLDDSYEQNFIFANICDGHKRNIEKLHQKKSTN